MISLPAFGLERCGYRADDPVVLVREQRGVLRVVVCSPAATRLGFRRGMSSAEARAQFAGVPQVLQEPEWEDQDRAELVDSFREVSDRVCAYGTEGIALEISTLRTHGGREDRVLVHTRSRADSLGHACRLVIADHPKAAAALAECVDQDLIVPAGEGAAWLADLPIEALHPSDALKEALRVIGLTQVGELAQLDPASVSGRYGQEGVGLWKVARGCGDPISGRTWGIGARAPLYVASALEGATSMQELHGVLFDLLKILLQRLADRSASLVQLALTLKLDTLFSVRPAQHRDVRMIFRVGRPTRNEKVLGRLIQNRLEGVVLTAPVEGLVLEVLEHVPEPIWQLGLTSCVESMEVLSELIGRVHDRMGDVTMFTPGLVSSWCPEEAWEPCSLFERIPPSEDVKEQHDDPVTPLMCWETGLMLDRPNRLLCPPQSLDVREGERGPQSLFFEKAWHAVEHSMGPERLTGGWWRARGGWSRDYWRVGVKGCEAWIFCAIHGGGGSEEGMGSWFLHGWFD